MSGAGCANAMCGICYGIREPGCPFALYLVLLCCAFDFMERDGWVNARGLNVNFYWQGSRVAYDMVRMKINGRSCSTAGNDRS